MLRALAVALPLAAALVQNPSPVKQVDHVMFAGGPELSGLVLVLRDKLELPVVFDGPSQAPPTPGTCLSFGNTCLEVVPLRPAPGDPPRTARLGSLALQATHFPGTVAALEARRIEHFPPSPQDRWTTIGLRGLGGGMFFIEYQLDMDQRRLRFQQELDRRDGGPLGVVRMAELSRSVAGDLRALRERWIRLLGAPHRDDGSLWTVGDGPALRLVGPDDPRANRIVVAVKSLDRAAVALRRLGFKFTATEEGLAVDPEAFYGLRMVLIETRDR